MKEVYLDRKKNCVFWAYISTVGIYCYLKTRFHIADKKGLRLFKDIYIIYNNIESIIKTLQLNAETL